MDARRVLRTTCWFVGALAGLLAIGYLTLLGINRNDEAPSAAAVRLEAMSARRPALADSRNAYVSVAALASGHAARRAARSAAVTAVVEAGREPAACEEALRAHPGALHTWRAAETSLLEHYAGMLAAEGFQAPAPSGPDAPFVDYSAALDAQLLHLLGVRRDAIAGDPGAVREALERDLAFWRRVLASSDLLLTRMVAVAAVERHFQLGQLALRDLQAPLALEAVPMSWRQPLTDAERGLMRPLAGEWRMVRGALMASLAPGGGGADAVGTSRLMRPLLQPQATLNRMAENLVGLDTLSLQPYPELAGAVRALREREEPASPGFAIRNPIGRVLASSHASSMPAYATYIARCADLEGLRRATLLAATLRGQGVPSGAMPDALGRARLRNPYDDAAFAWDAIDGAVVFEGLAGDPRARHAVAY